MNRRLSQTIDWLRFPLMVGVVFVHTRLFEPALTPAGAAVSPDYPLYNGLHALITFGVASLAVPLFFLFSGYLFFQPGPGFTRADYRRKLERRLRSWLVPYLLWIAGGVVLFSAVAVAFPALLPDTPLPFWRYGGREWLSACWGNPYPAVNPALWFLRDLLVMALLSPLLYAFVRTCRLAGVAGLGVLWLLDVKSPLPGLSVAALCFFACGAWCAVNRRDFVALCRGCRIPALLLYLVLLAADSCTNPDPARGGLLHNAGILTGMVALLAWTARGIEQGRLHVSPLLANGAFFIYLFHRTPTALLQRLWMRFVPVSDGTLALGYLLIPLLLVLVSLTVYRLLCRCLPRAADLLTGGRQLPPAPR